LIFFVDGVLDSSLVPLFCLMLLLSFVMVLVQE